MSPQGVDVHPPPIGFGVCPEDGYDLGDCGKRILALWRGMLLFPGLCKWVL